MRRACELWNDSEKALAHIHLAHARLPVCGEDEALRLFVADELLESGVPPDALMEAQGFDPAPLALLKYNPDQPRVPAGHGRESGEWENNDANVTPVAFRGPKGRRGHGGGGGVFDAIRSFLDWLREWQKRKESEPAPEKPQPRDEAIPATSPPGPPATEQRPKADSNKLHHVFDNPDHPFGDFVSQFGSQEAAFRAIADATREAVQQQHISGQFRITVEVGGRHLLVKGNVMDNGEVKIGTAYPWNN